MRKLLTLYIFISLSFLLVTIIEAQDRGVAVTAVEKEVIETEPRRVLTTFFQVTNETSKKREFIPDIDLPEGWNLITSDLSFELDADESAMRLISLFIPQTTSAGRYEILYIIRDREQPSISGFDTLYVTVLPITELRASLLEAPDYVIAGDAYQATFLITNGGNVGNTIRVKINSDEDFHLLVDTEKLQLAPGESETVTAVVVTDENIRKIIRHHIELTASVPEDKSSESQAESYVRVIPRITGFGDRFHKLPLRLSTSGHVSRRDGESKYGLQTELSGMGTLDEDAKRHIDFLFREPDIRDKSILAEHDEYRLDLQTESYELGFGDNDYHLSPLTEESLYGRGIKGKLRLKNIDFGGYYHKARKISQGRRSAAGYIGYSIKEKYRIGLNYLRKERSDDAGIVSLHGQLEPTKNTEVELEFASGNSDYAYLLRAHGYHSRWLSYFLNVLHAGPDYPGYYKDTESISGSITASLKSKLRLNVRLGQSKNNLDLDPTISSARKERRYLLGLNYRFVKNGDLFLEFSNRTFKDRFPQPRFDTEEKLYRLGADYSFYKLNFHTSFGYGESNDDLTDQSSKLEVYNLSSYFRPTSRQSYGGYIHYRNSDSDLTGRNQIRMTAGLSNIIRIGNRTEFELGFHTYKYKYSARDVRSRNFDMELNHSLRNKHSLLMRFRHSASGDTDTSTFMAEYSIPFGMPVSSKKSASVIKGIVYDEETREPIPNAILTLDGATAVTDGSGKFTFPFLKPNTYHLSINTARIGADRITVQDIPIEVTTKGGEAEFVEIGITRAAALSGQVMLYGSENRNGVGILKQSESRLVELHGLRSILVELSNQQEIKRRATDTDGRFTFEELRPGKWTLKVYEHNLPEYHYLENDTFEFDIEPGQAPQVLVKVLPKRRRIRIIEEGGTIEEEESRK